MRRGGVITARRKKRERSKMIRRRAMVAGLVLLLCALGMSSQLREKLTVLMEEGAGVMQTFAQSESEIREIVLHELELYALQLGVFDSVERAQIEQKRLMKAGVPCVIWQRDKMRLICSVAKERSALDLSAAGGNDAYIVRDTLPEVRLRVSCARAEADEAIGLIGLPDSILGELLSAEGRTLDVLITETREAASPALNAHPENRLYTHLASVLLDWCNLVEGEVSQPNAECYAAVTLCTICREWRNALLRDYAIREESTASAQRTPSTAADVMPPA